MGIAYLFLCKYSSDGARRHDDGWRNEAEAYKLANACDCVMFYALWIYVNDMLG